MLCIEEMEHGTYIEYNVGVQHCTSSAYVSIFHKIGRTGLFGDCCIIAVVEGAEVAVAPRP